jgi:hypothetical protein
MEEDEDVIIGTPFSERFFHSCRFQNALLMHAFFRALFKERLFPSALNARLFPSAFNACLFWYLPNHDK